MLEDYRGCSLKNEGEGDRERRRISEKKEHRRKRLSGAEGVGDCAAGSDGAVVDAH